MVVTRIQFTTERIIARSARFHVISVPYGSVLRLHSKPGTLSIEFSGGQSLKVHSGLADPEMILAHLRAHCPASVYSEES